MGLFYSSITTTGVTALDPTRASLAGGILYMCQIAGGAVGLGVNTAIVLAAATGRRDHGGIPRGRRTRGDRPRRVPRVRASPEAQRRTRDIAVGAPPSPRMSPEAAHTACRPNGSPTESVWFADTRALASAQPWIPD